MNEQLGKLEAIKYDISRAKTLVDFMTDYFGEARPKPTDLMTRYSMYGELNGATLGILHEALTQFDEAMKIIHREWSGIRNDVGRWAK
jgi:hypothetical protein